MGQPMACALPRDWVFLWPIAGPEVKSELQPSKVRYVLGRLSAAHGAAGGLLLHEPPPPPLVHHDDDLLVASGDGCRLVEQRPLLARRTGHGDNSDGGEERRAKQAGEDGAVARAEVREEEGCHLPCLLGCLLGCDSE